MARDAVVDFNAEKVQTASAKAPFHKQALANLKGIATICAVILVPALWIIWRAFGSLANIPILIQYSFYEVFQAVLSNTRNPMAFLEGMAMLCLGMGITIWGARKKKWFKAVGKPKASALHGTAGWADFESIKTMGILPPSVVDPKRNAGVKHSGVFIGSYIHKPTVGPPKTYYLRHDGPEHVLAFAPTRSGKGVGLVLPTLLTWEHSAIVHDPKGEAWALSAGFRNQELGQKVFNFDPAAADSSKVSAFNPLAEVRLGTKFEVGDAQNLANILADPMGEGLKDHWAKTSQALLVGLILHVCYHSRNELGRPARFSDMVEFLTAPDEQPQSYGVPQQQQQQQEGGLQKRLTMMRDYKHLPEGPHATVAGEAQSMLDKDERERASVASTAISFLTLYRDPAIAGNTGRSDWTISDLMDGDTPATAYLVVRPSDAERLRPLIRLIMTQIVRRLTGQMGFKGGRSVAAYKHRLLLLLDEFTALKKLTVIEEALAYMAGYGIKAYLIVQDIQQLEAVYGKEEMVLSNCHIKVAFAPNKIQTAEVIAKMVGRRTIVHKAARIGGKKGDGDQFNETSRDLMTPDEVMRLEGPRKNRDGDIERPGALLIIIAGLRPIYGTQVLYFKDSKLLRRSQIEAPELMNGEVGDTEGFVAQPRVITAPDNEEEVGTEAEGRAVQPVQYGPSEDVDSLLFAIKESPELPLWPTTECTGEIEEDEFEPVDVDLMPDIAAALKMIDDAISAEAEDDEETPMTDSHQPTTCREVALAWGAHLPPIASGRIDPRAMIPAVRLAELKGEAEPTAA